MRDCLYFSNDPSVFSILQRNDKFFRILFTERKLFEADEMGFLMYVCALSEMNFAPTGSKKVLFQIW